MRIYSCGSDSFKLQELRLETKKICFYPTLITTKMIFDRVSVQERLREMEDWIVKNEGKPAAAIVVSISRHVYYKKLGYWSVNSRA